MSTLTTPNEHCGRRLAIGYGMMDLFNICSNNRFTRDNSILVLSDVMIGAWELYEKI